MGENEDPLSLGEPDRIGENVFVVNLRAKSLESQLATAKAEIEDLVWNLAGCSTFAMGYGIDESFDGSKARAAMFDVLKLAKENARLKTEIDALKSANAIIIDGHTNWRLCYEQEKSENKRLKVDLAVMMNNVDKLMADRKRLREALESANATICDEFCSGSSHNGKCAQAALDGGKA